MTNKLPPLYGKTSAGKLQIWYVYTEYNNIYVVHGLVDGKKQEKITQAKGKNAGKVNATTDDEQAILEAKSKWQHQRDRGYFETKEEALAYTAWEPMKAQSFEDQAKKLIFPCYGQPKLDGCFGYNTLIHTSVGYKKIGDIVKNKLQVKVASFNTKTKNVEFKRVVNWFNNGYKPKTDWLLFNKKQKITKNHKVYTDGDWVRADGVGGKLFGVNPKFNACVAGMLLGDSVAAIEKRTKSSGEAHSWRLSFSVSEQDITYGETKTEIFNEFSWKSANRTSGYGYPQVVFTSSAMTWCPFDLSIFYELDRESMGYGKRRAVDLKKLKTVFGIESLLLWYMDDGSINYNNGNPQTPRMSICVARYDDETIEGFADMFTDLFRVTPSIGLYGVNKVLTFSTPDTFYLMSLIAPYADQMCPRKIHTVFKTGLLGSVPQYCEVVSNIGGQYNYGNDDSVYEAFDIEVEDNHNYFAEGVLVHNCRVMIPASGNAVSKSGLDLSLPKHWGKGLRLLEASGMLSEGLDGEVYAGLVSEGGLSLQEIVSAFRKENENTHKLEYYVYDIPGGGTFEERIEKLANLHDCIVKLAYEGIDIPIRVVYTAMIENSEAGDALYEELISRGYEGIMYRNAKGLYEHGKRSYDLIKRKGSVDFEALVLSVEEDKNGDGVMLCKTVNGEHIGSEFKVLMRIDAAEVNYRKYENALTLIGKTVTVQAESYSLDGVPTKPRGIAVRETDQNGQPLY